MFVHLFECLHECYCSLFVCSCLGHLLLQSLIQVCSVTMFSPPSFPVCLFPCLVPHCLTVSVLPFIPSATSFFHDPKFLSAKNIWQGDFEPCLIGNLDNLLDGQTDVCQNTYYCPRSSTGGRPICQGDFLLCECLSTISSFAFKF